MSGEPKISAETYREKRVQVRWPDNEGPVVVAPYTNDKRAMLLAVDVYQVRMREARIRSAYGVYMKKDGTPGAQEARISWRDMDDLPSDVRDVVGRALAGVAW